MHDPLGSGVDVEAFGPDEAEQGHAVLAGQLDGQARRRADGRQHRDAGDRRLLHQLEARPAADQQDGVVEGRAAGEERRADELVQGVVPADVLAHVEQPAVGVEQRRGVQAAGAVEGALRARSVPGSRWMTAASTAGRPAIGADRGRTRTASSDALPQTPQLDAA